MGRAPLSTSIQNATRMRAQCKISIGGEDVTGKLAPYLLQVTITKQRTGNIGEALIELDDRYGQLRLPTSDDPVEITLGWPQEDAFRVFYGKPADVTSRGQRRRGRTVNIKVEEKSLLTLAKTAINGSFGDGDQKKTTFGEVMEKAAKTANITIIEIDPKLKDVEIPYTHSPGEPFMTFADRLAKEYNGFIQLTEEGLRVIHNDTAANAAAQINATVGRNVLGWSIRPRITRTAWDSVGHVHFDAAKAKWIEEKRKVEQEDGAFIKVEPSWRSMLPATSKAEADFRNDANASDAIQNRGDGWIIIDGEPRAEPGATLVMKGARAGVDGNYTIDEVEHSYNRQTGFTTRLQVIKPTGTFKVDDSWKG
jgi:phage protein D